MTPVMLRAKRTGCATLSDDEDGLQAIETSTPNRHTLATSGGGGHHPVQRTFLGNTTNGGVIGIDTQPVSSSSTSIQSRRSHSKSLSLSEGKTLSKAFETPSLRLCTFSGSSQLFQQNRNIWEKRTEPEGSGGAGDRSSRNGAPDLVLDLPIPAASNSVSSSSSNSATSLVSEDVVNAGSTESVSKDVTDAPASPDAVEESGVGGGGSGGSGADCFAHNQYTLKKNDKFLLESSRHNFSVDNNNTKESHRAKESTAAAPPPQSVLHISEEEEQQQLLLNASAEPQPVVIAERNTHKFIAQFADLKLTGGSLPVVVAGSKAGSMSCSGGDGLGAAPELPIKPILRREKPALLKKPVLGTSSSGPSSLVSSTVGGGGAGLMSFNAKGNSSHSNGQGGDSGARSLE